MTEQEKLEKVIKGLSICLPETEADDEKTCEECPYWVCGDTVSIPIRLIEDIRALLKAQEPRVMTLEEVSALYVDDGENAPVWMETRIVTDRGMLTRLEASILWTVEDGWWRRFGPVHSGWEDVRMNDYDITWRCWTSRPTDAQREEAKWE